MRRLVCVVLLLSGCLRARATVVHPTDIERSSGGGGSSTTIARGSSNTPETTAASTNIGSVELGALIPFRTHRDSARVHIAPGVRVFGSDAGNVLFGVAVGADFVNRFTLEGSVYIGDGHDDPEVIDQAVDLFTGITMDAGSTSFAIGPSVGLLMMPGGHSTVMVGLGLRFTAANRDAQ